MAASPSYQQEHVEDATSCNPYRVRSISLPSRSHPLALRFQEELAALKSWASSSATNSTAHLVTGLTALSRVYDAIQNLLRMPGVRRAMATEHARRDGRFVADELEGSVRLLDAFTSARDSMGLVRDAARGLQCGIRTRTADPAAALRTHARDYAARRREAAREMAKCAREIKAILDEQQQGVDQVAVAVSVGSGDQQEDLSLIIGALRDTRAMATAALRAVLSFYGPKSASSKPASAGWGLVSKALLQKPKPKAWATVDGDDDAVEASLKSMLQKTKSSSSSSKQLMTGEADSLQVQRHLETLQSGAAGVETGLECVYRRLVRNRGDILNVVNNI